jgi:hypothetical protein
VGAQVQIGPGIDFAKLHFGRKLFGLIFIHPQISDKLPPKNNICKIKGVLWTIIISLKVFSNRIRS